MARKPIIALMYDFDKTLCTNDMQNYTFIPNLGIDTNSFWAESNALAKKEDMDGLLSYMYFMLKEAISKNISITRENFVKLGKGIEYYPGVEQWFERINQYGKERGVTIEHYIISSGLQEIIEGSSIYKYFKKTYACEFLYDVNKVAVWPKNVVNYTTKTQFLFRINKGVLDVYENNKLNTYTPENERRIPFRNMIYIGDGMTDVPCMKLVKANGGQSIAVFKKRNKTIAAKLMNENRVDFITEANYSENSELDNIVKTIIDKMMVVDRLTELHRKHKKSIEVKKDEGTR